MTESDDPTLTDEAASWAVRLDAGPLSAREQQALDAWLTDRPSRRGALIRARAAWVSLDAAAALRGSETNNSAADRSVATPGPRSDAPAAWNRRRAIAASLAAVTAGAAGWALWQRRAPRYVSAVGEIRRVPLSDGSTLQLNTGSEAEIEFQAHVREVRLVRGEGLFEVARDPSRPFVVRARGLAVTAIGTAFAVRVDESQVHVTVSEGVVALARESAPEVIERRLVAEEQAVARDGAVVQVRALPAAVVQRQLAWTSGMVAFDGETLQQAVDEVNRHASMPIVIADSQLARRPVVGIFRAADTESFVNAAATALGARVVRTSDRWMLVAPSAESATSP